ncbi:MAG TPA: toll/interleukin-1 receptor domain-containing protein [Phototrophicaceae bacterium]|nr:toll/interleukin-1 receptor domain-containing protein [Phototrophicaceae bacterium]
MNNQPAVSKRKIFISYRRNDHPDFVERIRDWFLLRYGRDSVFMDFDNIPPFTRFADYIRQRVRECDVLIAIVGPSWMDTLREREHHADEDYVRLEIRLALEEGKPIAPICIKGAAPPRVQDLPADLRPMLDYHMAFLNSGRDFLDNIERVVNAVEELLARLEMFSSVTQDIQSYRPPEFDVQAAILSFQTAADQQDWQSAQHWLAAIRDSGFMPRFYPIEDYEQEVRDALEREAAQRDYAIIRLMAGRARQGRENPARIWQALEAFWRLHPAYDPDDLTSEFRPDQVVAKVVGELSKLTKEATEALPSSARDSDAQLADLLHQLDAAEADEFFEPDALDEAFVSPFPADSIDLEKAVELGLITDMD